MSSAITDLNANMKLLLSKFGDREHPYQFDCGLSSQQFPLSSEEELQMLDTGALTNCFLSSSVNEKNLAELYDIATQDYFHVVRDKLIKRNRRKQGQVCNNLK
ncbi:unnamed protein product [Schistosoma mattheei]|uniref:Uncharacterized protein n=1 Tax=Schistosoma mattheei TaxID=31246 RepID=A0A183P6M8_9TREM|nr:unnamed protein product [Schistosoma mattheei]